MIPGEVVSPEGTIAGNVDLPVLVLEVVNTADRPIQVGSHYHLAASNPALRLDRDAAWGMRLDIPAGLRTEWAGSLDREAEGGSSGP